jgi:membrane protein
MVAMNYLQILVSSGRIWLRLEMGHYAAAFAYYAPFALVPLILVSLGISGLFYGLPFVKNMFLSFGTVFGEDLTTLVGLAVQNLDVQVHTYDVPVLAIVFFSAISILAFNVLGLGFERIWGKHEVSARSVFKQSLRSIGLILILQIYILTLVSLEGLWALMEFDGRLIPLLIWFSSISTVFVLIYRFLVAGSPSWRSCMVGGFTAGLLFIFAKNIVTLYLAAKPVLNMFGAAGLILVLLIWVYVLAAIIYYGAIVAHEYGNNRIKSESV